MVGEGAFARPMEDPRSAGGRLLRDPSLPLHALDALSDS